MSEPGTERMEPGTDATAPEPVTASGGASSSNGMAGSGVGDDTVRRAEELVDDMGQRVGEFAADLAYRLRRGFALAREEAEDVWAEAVSMRARWRG